MNVALFDFDGTIVDSGPQILGSVRATLAHFGLPVPPDIRGFVGPPILTGITEVLGVPAAIAEDFRDTYRSIYIERMTETDPYPGIPDLLADLAAEGWALGVASSKREDLVARILAATGLEDAFMVVAGADISERSAAKERVVARALALFAERGVEAGDAVMVGDRHHDVDGAAARGLPTIFVTWGYGTPAEAEGAWAVADSPDDVAHLLRTRSPLTGRGRGPTLADWDR